MEDYDLKTFIKLINKNFINSDLHIVSNNPYDLLNEFASKKLLPKATFVQIENLSTLDLVFFEEKKIFPAIQVGTDLNIYEKLIKFSERILVMTTIPGISGGVFNEDTYEYVLKIKKINPAIQVYVDGGVNDCNFEKLRFIGVHTVIIGSYLAKAENWKENYSGLSKKVSHSTCIGSISETIDELPTSENNDVKSIIEIMSKYRSNFVLITKKNEIIGIITDGDIKRRFLEKLNMGSIREEDNFNIPFSNTFLKASTSDSIEEIIKKIELR
jgi:pentose-5-phosphate-3-epimerase